MTVLFCRTILGEELVEETPNSKTYDLNVLKDREHAFPTEPADSIETVRVKSLRLAVIGRSEQRITLDIDLRKRNSGTVHDLMDDALDQESLPLTLVNVAQAQMQVVFRRPSGKKKTVSFRITWPDKCNLGDKPDHEIIKKYLPRWSLEHGESAESPAQPERSA